MRRWFSIDSRMVIHDFDLRLVQCGEVEKRAADSMVALFYSAGDGLAEP